MLQITVNKETNKATVVFNGKEEELNIVKVNKAGVKPGTHWVNMQKLGTPKKWATVNYNDHDEDTFVVEVDETACRVATKRVSRIISLTNIKDFLNDEQKAQFDELYAAAQAEVERQKEEEAKNAPVKEKKSRKLTPEELIAKKLAEIEMLKKVAAGEMEMPEKKSRKKAAAVAVEDLDAACEESTESAE